MLKMWIIFSLKWDAGLMHSWVWKQRLLNKGMDFEVASVTTETQTGERQKNQKKDTESTNLQKLHHRHWSEKGSALSI